MKRRSTKDFHEEKALKLMNASSQNDRKKVKSNFQSPNSYHQPETIDEINEDDISKTILQRNQRLGTNPVNQIVEQAKKGKGK